MERQKLRTEYKVEVTKDQFFKIIHTDNVVGIPTSDTLLDRVEKIPGVDNCDYNCHFGESVFYRVDDEHDNEKTHKRVEDTIIEYLAEALDRDELDDVWVAMKRDFSEEPGNMELGDWLDWFDEKLPEKFEGRKFWIVKWAHAFFNEEPPCCIEPYGCGHCTS